MQMSLGQDSLADTGEKSMRAIHNSIGMEFVQIPPGRQLCGSRVQERTLARQRLAALGCEVKDLFENEWVPGEVVIPESFWLSATLVTQDQFYHVSGLHVSTFSTSGENAITVAGRSTGDFPADSVTYEAAEEFCRLLTALPVEREQHRRYRLPTEREWEYACRAGGDPAHPWNTGVSLTTQDAMIRPYDSPRVQPETFCTPSPVRTFKPNAWGLYDMHGNLSEWCSDWSDDFEIYQQPRRVIRGGCYFSDQMWCRSATRDSVPPNARNSQVGFRVLLEKA